MSEENNYIGGILKIDFILMLIKRYQLGELLSDVTKFRIVITLSDYLSNLIKIFNVNLF